MSNSFTRLEYDDGNTHRKYWQIELIDAGPGIHLVQTEWGKLDGQSGQHQVKTFSDTESAQKHVEQKVAEKRRKGYAEAVTVGREAVPVPARVQAVPSDEKRYTADDYLAALGVQ